MEESNSMIIQSGGTGFGKRKATIAERMIKVTFKLKKNLFAYIFISDNSVNDWTENFIN